MSKVLIKNLDQADQFLTSFFPLKTHTEEISLKVGPIAVRALMPGGFFDTYKPRYEGFLWGGECDYRVEAERAPDIDLSEYRNILVQSRPGGKIHYAFRWDFLARIDTEKQYAYILLSPMGSPLCLDSIFRIVVSFSAVDNGGFLLHSAAIASESGAYLFCGISGCGKSTIARVSKDRYKVMTDEMSLVEKVNGGYRVWGTPFWGELQMSVNCSAPLKALLLLSQSPHIAIETVSIGEGLPEFMKTILFFGLNMKLSNILMDASLEFLGSVPFGRLKFLPDASLWEVIHDTFEQ